VPQCIVRSADPERLVAGVDARLDGGRNVVRRPGVPGQLRGGAADAGPGQRLDVPGVETDSLAGQQIVIDRLGQQRMPEGVSVATTDQYLALDRTPDRLVQVGGR
jgi:hypothetical protein